MPHTGTPVTTIAAALDRLGRFEPVPLPVISLYVDLRADDRGQHNVKPFVKKELQTRARTYLPRSAGRESFDRDIERIGR